MRLGYLHYSDWTSLPAPLFFKRKIDDYVIRYRSSISSATDDAADTDDLAVPSTLRANGDAPDANSAETQRRRMRRMRRMQPMTTCVGRLSRSSAPFTLALWKRARPR